MPSELTLEERAKKISIGYPSHQGVLNHLRAVQAETEERARVNGACDLLTFLGWATGHGDTFEDVAKEAEWQKAETEERVRAERDQEWVRALGFEVAGITGNTPEAIAQETELDLDEVTLRRARREERERCARIVERHKPGWTSSLDDGGLVRDPDGPWGLGEDFAAAIREGK